MPASRQKGIVDGFVREYKCERRASRPSNKGNRLSIQIIRHISGHLSAQAILIDNTVDVDPLSLETDPMAVTI